MIILVLSLESVLPVTVRYVHHAWQAAAVAVAILQIEVVTTE